MAEDAIFVDHDMPICPTTTTTLPKELISWKKAVKIHESEMSKKHYRYHVNAFVHFYTDDQDFDDKGNESIWLNPRRALKIIRHFDGAVAPDFSTNTDFPDPIKRWNYYRMSAFGYWLGKNGVNVIVNARWGEPDTWGYCWNSLCYGDMIAIGTVASGIKKRINRPLFENGFRELINRKHPWAIVVYGSANYKVFTEARAMGIIVKEFPSETSKRFRRCSK